MKEACPAADGQEDKPSPDSGCSLGFSPLQPGEGEQNLHRPDSVSAAGDTAYLLPEPSSVDGNSSELEEEEEEVGRGAEVQTVPQTPDQEAFLKEHFVTLAHLSSSGRSRQPSSRIQKQTFDGRLTRTGSPGRTSHSSSENISISSRFFTQSSGGR